jgi:hypothetical protein
MFLFVLEIDDSRGADTAGRVLFSFQFLAYFFSRFVREDAYAFHVWFGDEI